VWGEFAYASSAWGLTATKAYRHEYVDGSVYVFPQHLKITTLYPTPEARTSLPVLFTTEDDTYGLFTIKGTYREIASFYFEAPA